MIVIDKSASRTIKKHSIIALELSSSTQCLFNLHQARMQTICVLIKTGKLRIASSDQIKQHEHLLQETLWKFVLILFRYCQITTYDAVNLSRSCHIRLASPTHTRARQFFGQMTGAIHRITGRPVPKCLLAVKEDQLNKCGLIENKFKVFSLVEPDHTIKPRSLLLRNCCSK